MNAIAVRLEEIISRLERSGRLDLMGRAAGSTFARVIRPGRLKDLLSGTWLGHPLHPILTDLPLGAWTSSLILDLLPSKATRGASDSLVGLGVVAAIPTAITGLSELSDVVNDDERSLGTAHALGNVGAVVLYGVSYVCRRRGSRLAGTALSFAGAGVAAAAGYLGGHLVYRKAVGPSHTALDRPIGDWVPVLDANDLPEGRAKRVSVQGIDVLLYRDKEAILALANRCTHRGGPLHKGQVGDGRVTCPWHLSSFRLQDGSIVRGPATAPQPVYETRERGGKIEVRSRGPGGSPLV